jgi:hypothetical protein
MNNWLRLGLPLVAVGAIGAALGASTACSSNSSSSSSSSGSGSGAGGACPASLTPGTFPDPTCFLADETSCGTPSNCQFNAQCGPTTTGSCENLTSNTGKTQQDFRIRRLNVVAPAGLTAGGVIQSAVVNHGIDLPQSLGCGSNGDGSFSWLIRVDTSASSVMTGGAPPTSDPIGQGYCFVNTNAKIGSSTIALAPSTVSLHKNADGSYDSDQIAKLNIGVYYLGVSPPQIIVLPISGGKLKGMTISSDGNCIGSFDSTATSADSKGACNETNSTTCSEWKTAGSLGGYITLEDADKVPVPQLSNHSLCVLLTGSSPIPDGQPGAGGCQRDASGKIKFQGDFCSTTGTAGGCADAYWLAATFAASAVKITDGTGVADCSGGSSTIPDAGGGDSGSGGGTDSGSTDAASE